MQKWEKGSRFMARWSSVYLAGAGVFFSSLLSTLKPLFSSNNPKHSDATCSVRAKRRLESSLQSYLDYICIQCILRETFEENVQPKELVAIACVCVCFVCWSKPISLQKCLPSRWWVSGLNSKKEQPGALTVQAKQTFYELFDQQQVYSDWLTADSFWLVNSRYNLISQQQVHFDWLTAGQYYLVNIMFILIHQEQVHSDWSTAG